MVTSRSIYIINRGQQQPVASICFTGFRIDGPLLKDFRIVEVIPNDNWRVQSNTVKHPSPEMHGDAGGWTAVARFRFKRRRDQILSQREPRGKDLALFMSRDTAPLDL